MAVIVATDTSTPIVLQSSDRLYVGEDVDVITGTGRAITSDTNAVSHRIAIDGTVVAMSSQAILLQQDSNGNGVHDMLIGATGVVRSLFPNNAAIWMMGSGSNFQNYGEVSGTWGLYLEGYASGFIENHGTITGEDNQHAIELEFGSTDVSILNTGLMSGGSAVYIDSGTATINNSGTMLGSGKTEYVIHVTAGNGSNEVYNSGEILSLHGNAIWFGEADDWLDNSGLIQGYVATGDGADIVRNFHGTIEGTVALGDGDDIFLSRHGEITGVVSGGAGEDKLRGGSRDDTLFGGDDNDLVRGLAGDDILTGDDGADTLKGGRGSDEMLGGIGADVLRGGQDNDTIKAGSGNDLIAGNQGDDLLTGGLGRDTFVFGRNAGVDTITDFQNGKDKIDLSGLGLKTGEFATKIAPALTNAGNNTTLLDLEALGGEGSVLIQGLAFADANGTDFIL
jgi:Ca2+-binding RTX toxin-like protein